MLPYACSYLQKDMVVHYTSKPFYILLCNDHSYYYLDFF